MAKLGYTWYPKDFISDPDVMFMTACERGVYRDIIDLAYMSDNKIRYSAEMLARYTNSDVETVEKVLSLKGQKRGDYWTIPSCEKRLALANKNRVNGAKGGRPKTQTKPKQNPVANHTVIDNKTQTERQREIEREIERESEEDSHARTHEAVSEIPSKPEWYLYRIDELLIELTRSQTWKESVGMQYRLLPNEIDPWLTRFAGHLKASGEETKTIRDGRKHFSSWLRIQLEKLGSENGVADDPALSDPTTPPDGSDKWKFINGKWRDTSKFTNAQKRRNGLL